MSETLLWNGNTLAVNNVWNFKQVDLHGIWNCDTAEQIVKSLNASNEEEVVAAFTVTSWLLKNVYTDTFEVFNKCGLPGQMTGECDCQHATVAQCTLEILCALTAHDDDFCVELIENAYWHIILLILENTNFTNHWQMFEAGVLCVANLINTRLAQIETKNQWALAKDSWSAIEGAAQSAFITLLQDRQAKVPANVDAWIFVERLTDCLASLTIFAEPETQTEKETMNDYSRLLLQAGVVLPNNYIWTNIADSEPYVLIHASQENTKQIIQDYVLTPWENNWEISIKTCALQYLTQWVQAETDTKLMTVMQKNVIETIFNFNPKDDNTDLKQDYMTSSTSMMLAVVHRGVTNVIQLDKLIEFASQMYLHGEDNEETTINAALVLHVIIDDNTDSCMNVLTTKYDILSPLRAGLNASNSTREQRLCILKSYNAISSDYCTN